MDKFTHFIGIDISKDYFDATILLGNTQKHDQFLNTKKGAQAFLKWMKNEDCLVDGSLICMEHYWCL